MQTSQRSLAFVKYLQEPVDVSIYSIILRKVELLGIF